MSGSTTALEDFSEPLAFTMQTANAAPQLAGVHVVVDSEGVPVYVGATSDLRRRLRQHLRGNRQGSVLHEQVGDELDRPDRPATGAEITEWLARCTVSWRPTDDPRGMKARLVAELQPRFNRAAEQPPSGIWWVNQGQSFDAECSAGIVFAGSGGPQVAHHLNVRRVRPGDVVLHYRQGAIVALGDVVTEGVDASRPYGPATERGEGWLARVEYFPLSDPVSLASLPERDGSEGPFNAAGGVKQGYLFPLDAGFAATVRNRFADRWPAGSPWAKGERRFWLFQANPKQWDLLQHLPDMPPGHVDDWTVTRHRADMEPGDGVLLWQGGSDAGVYALGRLTSRPELRPTPEFRPESSGRQEYRVDLVVERHVLPPITRAEAQAHPVLARLDVLRRPWGGTNSAVTPEQWRAVRALAPLEPGLAAVHWDPLVHWAVRFAESLDLEETERRYKLAIAARLLAAANALRTDDPEWPRLLRRSFGPPNNLTAWRMHGTFLSWVDEHRAEARTMLQALWDSERDVHAALESFCALLPVEISGDGTKTNLASFLLGARDVTRYPIYRVTPFSAAHQLTGWTHRSEAEPADRYAEALQFLDAFSDRCRARGVSQIQDRLDAQGLLWQVLAGQAPPGWDAAEIEAYQRFLGGQDVDELSELVQHYRAATGYPEGGRPEREAEREELAVALTPEALADPDVRLLRRLAGPAYGSGGPQPGLNKLLQNDEDVARVTDTLRYLLYGPGDIVDRLDECIRGERKLPRVGEAMMVKALAVIDPQRWIPCYVTGGRVGKLAILELLGVDAPWESGTGAAAAASNDAIRERLEPHLPDDPWGMQEFTWWLLHRERVPETPLAALAEELYLDGDFLARILRLLDDKGQVVFYGPPGTGKTFVARKLAGHIARGGGTVEKVQFHPSYAYEDFIEGYRPRLVDGQVTYEVVDGPLKRIAARAQERPDVTHVLLIDELNRANVAKVLGELLFLLEYRDEEIRLQYSDTLFALPPNLQIIATMNTADRSIALVDTALRRRFHFVPFFPHLAPIDSLLRRWLADRQPDLRWVADVVDRANEKLADHHVAIGPSHFLKPRLTEELVRLTWESSVIPYLEEYFFADPDQVRQYGLDQLRAGASALKDAGEPDTGVDEAF
ncbi:AAA family ATPase [Geodermatophilus sp. SYSU D00742]